MQEQKPRTGYIRCEATHIGVEWQFEMLSETPKVAIATITTQDGPLHVGLNRADAVQLERRLRLFLADWPEDKARS